MTTDNNLSFKRFFGILARSPLGRPYYLGLGALTFFVLLWVRSSLAFACIAVAAVIILYFIVIGVIAAALYFRYKNRFGEMPICYKLDGKALKITYGDRTSHHTYNAVLKKQNVRRVWQQGPTVYITHRWLTRAILLPRKKRREFLSALHEHGWSNITGAPATQRVLYQTAGIILCAAVALSVAYAFYDKPAPAPNIASQAPKVTLQPEDIVKELNSKRTARGKAPLNQDANLIRSATDSCKDMETNKYFGNQNPETGHSGYEYIRQYYADRWIVEVSLAITDGFTAEQIASRWVESKDTTDTVLDERYTMGAAVTCNHTVNDDFDKIIVLHLAS